MFKISKKLIVIILITCCFIFFKSYSYGNNVDNKIFSTYNKKDNQLLKMLKYEIIERNINTSKNEDILLNNNLKMNEKIGLVKDVQVIFSNVDDSLDVGINFKEYSNKTIDLFMVFTPKSNIFAQIESLVNLFPHIKNNELKNRIQISKIYFNSKNEPQLSKFINKLNNINLNLKLENDSSENFMSTTHPEYRISIKTIYSNFQYIVKDTENGKSPLIEWINKLYYFITREKLKNNFFKFNNEELMSYWNDNRLDRVSELLDGITDVDDLKDKELALDLFINEFGINRCFLSGSNLILLTSSVLDFDLLKLILEKGGNINSQEKLGYNKGSTPLIYALDLRDYKMFNFLLKNNACPDFVRYRDGVSALILAVQQNRVDIVKLLIEHKANVNIKDNQGWSALTYASRYEYCDIAKLLLKNDAKINESDNFGYTPLMIAVMNGHLEMVKLLCKNGADKTLKVQKGEYKGYTALKFAEKFNKKELIKVLKSNK